MSAEGVNGERTLFVISDATGDTAAMVMRAAIDQFDHKDVRVHTMSDVKTPGQVREFFERAQACKGLIAITFVDRELQRVADECEATCSVPVVDIMPSIVEKVSTWLGMEPKHEPGRHHRRDGLAKRKKVAFDFTSSADDGQRPDQLLKAEIVVLGVSRSSKTPVCFALAFKGYKAANCPLVLDRPLPVELEKLDPRRVFLLNVDAPVIQRRRQERHAQSGHKGPTAYTDPREIRRELVWVAELAAKHPGWTPIDATYKGAEESVAAILKHYTDRFGDPTL